MSYNRSLMPPTYYLEPMSILASYIRFGVRMVFTFVVVLILLYILQPWFVITIKLKNGGWELGVKKAGIMSLQSNSEFIEHEVRSGETLSGIAEKYGIRQSDLQRWNDLENPNQIFVAQRLRIFR